MDFAQGLQSAFVYLASFVVVLSVVVFVHEFGHFQVARWRGVAIDTFSIGFGKTLLGWRDKSGVQWKIGALPLGGYVKFADDADAMSTAPRERIEDPAALAEARARGLFHAQPLLTRSLVVAAGPVTNFIFSILAFGIFAFIVGRDTARIDQVTPGSTAQIAGVHAHDLVVSINGVHIDDFAAFQRKVSSSLGQQLDVIVRRDGHDVALTMTPHPSQANPQLGAIGVVHNSSFESYERIGVLTALSSGVDKTWGIIAQTGSYISQVLTGRASGNQIAGVVGIFMVSGESASSALNVQEVSWTQRLTLLGLTLLSLAAVLSVAVGFVNLLPIPILDGGHLLFYAIEGVRGGKPLPAIAQEWAYRAGFAVMASLFLFATWNDITRLLPGPH